MNDTINQINEAQTLRTLNAFAVDVITIPSVEDLVWYVAQNVAGRLNFVDCVIYRANDDQTELTQVAALGDKNPYGRRIVNPLKIPFGQGITGQVAQTRKAIIVDDLLKNQNYIPDTQTSRSEICVPLICDGRILGVIDSEHPLPGAFGPAELETLITIAAMTTAKLQLLAEAERSNQRYLDLVSSHADLSKETSSRKALEAELFTARKHETIGRLTGKFAHEFNNLLTVISGNLDLLESEITDPIFIACMDDARTAAARGATLINDMLAFAQRTRLVSKIIDMNVLVAAICQKRGMQTDDFFNYRVCDRTSFVCIDPAAFETVLVQIIDNAKDAIIDGGKVSLSMNVVDHSPGNGDILVTPLPFGAYVRIAVQDEGMGIPMDRIEQVFDPFYTTKPVGQGTGLGLSMVLGFMQQSGGTVSVASKVGMGATFALYFPVAVAV
jgi:signal transduction histidine kinase